MLQFIHIKKAWAQNSYNVHQLERDESLMQVKDDDDLCKVQGFRSPRNHLGHNIGGQGTCHRDDTGISSFCQHCYFSYSLHGMAM